jgi:hypothetical protein
MLRGELGKSGGSAEEGSSKTSILMDAPPSVKIEEAAAPAGCPTISGGEKEEHDSDSELIFAPTSSGLVLAASDSAGVSSSPSPGRFQRQLDDRNRIVDLEKQLQESEAKVENLEAEMAAAQSSHKEVVDNLKQRLQIALDEIDDFDMGDGYH